MQAYTARIPSRIKDATFPFAVRETSLFIRINTDIFIMSLPSLSPAALLATTTLTLLGTAAVAETPTLAIGDPAPPIEAMAWIKGEPVKTYKPGHVYVVEFWATWCGPCIAFMPHLSELARRHAGKLTVIGVNVMEARGGDPRVGAVRTFVERKGAEMDYTVAMDDPATGPVFEAWMKAGGSSGIPTSFIVDGAGSMVWMGHPLGERLADFDRALEQALAGNSDLAAARAVQAETNTQNEARQRRQRELKPLRDAQARQDYPTVVTEAHKLAALDPNRYRAMMFWAELAALMEIDGEQAQDLARRRGADPVFRRQIGLANEKAYWESVNEALKGGRNPPPP